MITLYELLHHTTATKYKILSGGETIELDVDNFMKEMSKIGGCIVWQFSALEKDSLEIIIKSA